MSFSVSSIVLGARVTCNMRSLNISNLGAGKERCSQLMQKGRIKFNTPNSCTTQDCVLQILLARRGKPYPVSKAIAMSFSCDAQLHSNLQMQGGPSQGVVGVDVRLSSTLHQLRLASVRRNAVGDRRVCVA